ncbi:ABC transporter ATP-binding protein [Maricaulis sp.]|uniref:ABC transporter ATP-binding protein n=1 Tax=Maricaulis sp. TaxID=1486257 RepID=UPI00261276D6|nr:ABC transporter ATP-binding protein [Maricaulis sp.]
MSGPQFRNARFGYGSRLVIDGLDLCLETPGVTALVGPNGAGKSTLLKLAAGLLAPTSGRVFVNGRALAGMPDRDRARTIGYLAPDGRSAWPVTVRTIVALGRAPWLKPLRRLSGTDEAAIARAMDQTGVTGLAERRFDTLSSGERARVLLARVLAGETPVLVLDEPTAALDIRHQLGVMEILRSAAARGAHVVVAVHALDLAARYADRVVVLRTGAIAADGAPADALGEDVMRDVFGISAPGGIRPTPLDIP